MAKTITLGVNITAGNDEQTAQAIIAAIANNYIVNEEVVNVGDFHLTLGAGVGPLDIFPSGYTGFINVIILMKYQTGVATRTCTLISDTNNGGDASDMYALICDTTLTITNNSGAEVDVQIIHYEDTP